jgi:hypothetical protein
LGRAQGRRDEEGCVMEEILKALALYQASCTKPEELRWKLEELIDDYIDKRIERRLDQEFNRGEYSSW